MSTLEVLETTLEKMPVKIFSSSKVAQLKVASEIADLIRKKQERNEVAVLGLATGATPIGVYEELVRMHQEEGLSFYNVVTFNLDEYYPIASESLQSYYYFMHEHLFNHIDIPKENINIPDGTLPIEDVSTFCLDYEKKIDAVGGIDIQLLGIGRTGHIGFNEPPSHRESITRMVKLDPITISDAKREFIREELVPRRAITMGIKSIFKARKVFLMAWGESKASVVAKAVEGPVSEEIPASFLQSHPNVDVLIDEHASLELSRIKTPWLVSMCKWDEKLTKRAVIWLSQNLGKPILKLTDDDYKLNELGDLLMYYEDAQELNLKIFNSIQHTITGWPGGKPNADDTHRPERALPERKRVIIFSPHPDDDVISMGGTFLKLVEQGHDVHVAYQTSGNIAVFDNDARRFADFMLDFTCAIGIENDKIANAHDEVVKFLEVKKQGEKDTDLVKLIKGLIRKGEAAMGARFCGLEEANIHFLNLPFYETGSEVKKDIGSEDIKIVKDLLLQVQPHQVFAAGDLRDPHGTHKLCLDIIFESLRELKTKKETWINDCYFWLYRGAWQEFPVDEIDMAIPLSPSDLLKKRKAIFMHQSQKDTPVFPGNDKREFWQRAEERNRATAKIYDQLGMTEYEAIEAFVRYHY